jgi:hypothetical protein
MKRLVGSAVLTALCTAGVLTAMALPTDDPVPTRSGFVKATYAPAPGSVRIEARVDDPGGDAPWVLRVWRTRDNLQACEQLGREVDGVVGDVGADGRFRPLAFGQRTLCSPRTLDQRTPLVQVATFLDDPLADDPKPLRTVAWGIAGLHAEKVTVDGPGGRYTAPETPWHGWINVRGGDVATYEMVTKIDWGGGAVDTIDYGRSRRPSRHPTPRTVTVDARAAAPQGGPDFGLLAWRTQNGSTCSTQGRLLGGDRVGAWDTQGTFFDYPIGEGGACSLPGTINREQPFAYSLSAGFSSREAPVLSGIAAPEVDKVITEGLGPRRELEPGPHGGVLALYPQHSGRLRITVVFDDGTRKELGGLRIPKAGRRARYPRITAIRPKVVPVTPRGSLTLKVSCSERPRLRLCMSGLYLWSAESYKRPSGLSYKVHMANRLVRIGRGVKDRPLRLHLTGKGLSLLKRERSVLVDAGDLYNGKRTFRLRLVMRGHAGAASPSVIVDPRVGGHDDKFTLAWRVPEPMDNNGDAYLVKFSGPGGDHCSATTDYDTGVTWNVRYNHRYESRRARMLLAEDWCSGHFSGKVIFRDYPRGLRRGKNHTSLSCTRAQVDGGKCKPVDRLVGRFSFDVSP